MYLINFLSEYWNVVVDYIQMVKSHVKDTKGLNTVLSLALVKVNRLDDLEKLCTYGGVLFSIFRLSLYIVNRFYAHFPYSG